MHETLTNASKNKDFDKKLIEEMKLLLQIDLSDYPVKRFQTLYTKLNWTTFDLAILKPGDIIIRARMNSDSSFNQVNEISYKPQHLNNTFRRASIPNETMFYGCFIPNNHTDDEFDNALLSSLFEVVPIDEYDNSNDIVKKKVTFGVWEVTSWIPLPVIMTLKEYYSGKNHCNFHEPRTWLIMPNEEEMKIMDKYMHFLKYHFTKKVQFDYDYIPSAIFTEFVLTKGYKGIYYPGIKTEYDTYSVALSTDAVNDINLQYAFEANVYIKEGTYLIESTYTAKPARNKLNYYIRKDENLFLSNEEASNIITKHINKK